MHGHNYVVWVTAEPRIGPLTGLPYWVLDFGELDRYVKPIVEALDHRFILTRAHELPTSMDGPGWVPTGDARKDIVKINAPSSTAEALAEWLCKEIQHEFEQHDVNILVTEVVVWETQRNSATYRP
jgi:6-pyruvoyl-tetrahydropterin synthase